MNRVLLTSVVLAGSVAAEPSQVSPPDFHLQLVRELSTRWTIREVLEPHHSCSILR